jgi:YwiC-like protein
VLPREHGAYSQMALPLVTSLVVARAAPPALFVAVAVVCGFLAHEPLLLLMGGRGVRARHAAGSRAAIWFATTLCAMVAFAAIPICLAAGVRVESGTSIALVFALLFVTGVLCVRAIVLRTRGGGNPGASRTTRLALFAVAVVGVLAIGIGVTRAWVPWATLLAVTPGVALAVALATRRSPRPLKTVGWSIALTSAAAALMLIGTLRST